MGHLVGKDIYQRLGSKLDGLTVRTPWNDTFYGIMKALYSADEAEVVLRMPYSLSDFERLEKATGFEGARLQKILESLCSKGLIMDLWLNDRYYYSVSPFIIGIFEFTMMRTGGGVDHKEMAGLFHEYIDGTFMPANIKDGDRVSVMRALPHEDALGEREHIEVLDYEKASAIIDKAEKFSVGICSCRHEKLHLGQKKCDVPLEKCSSFGMAADYLIRNKLAREVSKSEMLDNLQSSKEMGLVLNADNVKNNISFICHCCKCCCHPLQAISKHGYTQVVVTSNYIAHTEMDKCKGCGKCAKACPIDAIEMRPVAEPKPKARKKDPRINTDVCLGCGVCALKCETGALKLVNRGQRVLHPETTFERIILQCLEKGTLQNQLFDNPDSKTHEFMRGFMGGFLRLGPVKRALMSETLRSSFLGAMKKGVVKQGKGWVLDI